MIPELGAVYSLTPDAVWSMTRRQYAQYLQHHDRLVKAAADG